MRGNNSSTTFNYKKKEIIRQNLEWLGKKELPVFVKNIPNVFCVCSQDLVKKNLVVTIINLGSDPTEKFEIDLAENHKPKYIEILDNKGQWINTIFKQSGRTVEVPEALVLMKPVIIRIS